MQARADVAVTRGRVLGECTNIARELTNEPGNTLTPREFANAGRRSQVKRVSKSKSSTRSKSRARHGLLLGVARGAMSRRA
jgi:leucyl aminopeptidase